MENDVEEIDADGDEEVLERVGAIDVAKASGKVCVRIPGPTTTDHEGLGRHRDDERDHRPRRRARRDGHRARRASSPPRTTGGPSSTCLRHEGSPSGS